LLALVTSNLLRLDMKLVAPDVKIMFCFSSVCVVMLSDLFWPLFFFVISEFSLGFSSYSRCNRQVML